MYDVTYRDDLKILTHEKKSSIPIIQIGTDSKKKRY